MGVQEGEPELKLVEIHIPGQKIQDGVALPVVLQLATSPCPRGNEDEEFAKVVEFLKSQSAHIKEQFLLGSGAVLLRGLGLRFASDFDSVVKAFGYEESSYSGGHARRSQVVGSVYTSNESPLHVNIPFHHEMAHLPNYPLKLFFYCELAPTEGGETPLVWSHMLVKRLTKELPEFVRQLEEKGVLYTWYFRDGPRVKDPTHDSSNAKQSFIVETWPHLFGTSDKVEAEKSVVQSSGGTSRLSWLPEGGVKLITGPLPGIKSDPDRGRKIFFNYVVMLYITNYPQDVDVIEPFENVTFGDGSSIPREAVMTCMKIMDEEKMAFAWQTGDVLLIDNHAVLHARNPCFTPRRVLASLAR